ncbi:MAG: aldo/keto reductase [Clostridiales Family XIII bacterium]|nr:aldo/keto reductase [Clostridiales Family XIII bacterium]
MKYRVDEKSGAELSQLGFGCMRYPRSGAVVDRAATERMILAAIEGGINYFDTAYIYGSSEEILGDILYKNGVRDKVYIATKLPHMKCKAYADFDRIFSEQLTRLKTDHIDYYLIHNLSDPKFWLRLKDLGIGRWIAEKKSQGAISRIGFSFHGTQEGFLEILEDYAWEFCQIQYNYMNENYQAGKLGLERAHAKGIPVIIMEPLLGGKLANNLPREAADALKNAGKGMSPAEWALRWVWNHHEATVVLSGMSAGAQLEENLRIAETAEADMLTDSELAAMEPIRAAIEKSYKVHCTGCNYCMPCPKRVNIPGVFTAYNISHAISYIAGITNYLTSIAPLKSDYNFSVRNCVSCGQCVQKCPQHIDIPGELKNAAKRMEPFWMRPIIKIAGRVMS